MLKWRNLADAADSKSADRNVMWVRVPPSAPIIYLTLHSPAPICWYGGMADTEDLKSSAS